MKRHAGTDSPKQATAGTTRVVSQEPQQGNVTEQSQAPGDSSAVRSRSSDQLNKQAQDLNLQSPFAAADLQRSPERLPVSDTSNARKRARHSSPAHDSLTHSKLQQLAAQYRQAGILPVNQSDPIMIHRPTPQRPAAGAAYSFGLPAVPSPPKHSMHAFSPATAAIPIHASCAFVPDSLATAAALANAVAHRHSPSAEPDTQQHTAAKQELSNDSRALQGPAASECSSSAEGGSDNSQSLHNKPQPLSAPSLVPHPNLSNISTTTSMHLPQAFGHSPSYLTAQQVPPTLIQGASLAPFTTYGGFPGSYPHASPLQAPTTYVVVSGNSPKRAASSSDKYVAAVVQDAQGNSQHVTVAASAISTGGPSYVLPATSTIPVSYPAPYMGQQTVGFGAAAQGSFVHPNTFAQPFAGISPLLATPGAWPGMGLSLPTTFGISQPALSAVQRFQSPLLPGVQVNVQDNSHCVTAASNVRIY